MTVEILIGDCRKQMAALPAGCVHTCVTSPPYFGLRDYGVDGEIGSEPTPEEFIAAMVEVFCEVRRVLRDDGTVWLNLGDSYGGARGGPQGRSGQMATRSVSGHRDARSRSKTTPGGYKQRMMIPARVALALQADGWWLRDEIIWHKPNPTPASVTDRTTPAHEMIYLLSKSPRYFYDAEAVRERAVQAGRVRADKMGGNKGDEIHHSPGGIFLASDTRNRRSVWKVATKPFKGAHFATFPPDLIKPCILAGCPKGGTVLDPFGGAGTTGLVAQVHGRNAILCELNPEYAEMARDRVDEAAATPLQKKSIRARLTRHRLRMSKRRSSSRLRTKGA